MSFILEALRKSEQERQRQAGPGFAELRPTMARPRFPVWAVALGALLAINLVVLLVVMLRRDESHAAPALPATASAPSPAVPGPSPAPANPASGLPEPMATAPLRSEMPAAEPEIRDSRVNLERQARAREEDYGIPEEPTPEELEPELQPPPRASDASDAESDAQLPTINEVALQTSLPELHLDIHVYAAQPADRFVFLNNRKYREGDETPEGTKVERITRDGVVLNHRGVRFLLPRQ